MELQLLNGAFSSKESIEILKKDHKCNDQDILYLLDTFVINF